MKVIVLSDTDHSYLLQMCKQACDTLAPSALTIAGGKPLLPEWEHVMEKVKEAQS